MPRHRAPEPDDGRPPSGPAHIEFDYCARSFTENPLPDGQFVTVINYYPFGTELRRWLCGEASSLPVITDSDQALTNPFSKNCSFLVWTFTRAYSDFAEFVLGRAAPGFRTWEIDLVAMRHASEVLLYCTRLAECLFKQLLYCTNFPPEFYMAATLGNLLSQKCRSCTGKEKHKLSLLGSLAHRYGMCGVFEHCIERDLLLLNGLRNTQAAHATVGDLILQPTPEEAWSKARFVLDSICSTMAHLLQHIEELEQQVLSELRNRLRDEEPSVRTIRTSGRPTTGSSRS